MVVKKWDGLVLDIASDFCTENYTLEARRNHRIAECHYDHGYESHSPGNCFHPCFIVPPLET